MARKHSGNGHDTETPDVSHIRNVEVRKWLQRRMEPKRNRPGFDLRKKRRILLKLNAAGQFETFLHSHYVGQKRFSLEGGEMLIPLLSAKP